MLRGYFKEYDCRSEFRRKDWIKDRDGILKALYANENGGRR